MKVEVKLSFFNKKQELKQVKFFMDKHTYEILFDKSVDEIVRHQYLIDEYHEYEKERYYQRKFVPFDTSIAEAFGLIRYKSEIYDENYEMLIDAIKKLSLRQQEILFKVYFENKKQVEVAKELGVSKCFVSKTLAKAINNLKIILEKVNF